MADEARRSQDGGARSKAAADRSVEEARERYHSGARAMRITRVIDPEGQLHIICSACCSYTVVFHLGGAVARTDPATAAFSGRHARHALKINAMANDADRYAGHRSCARTFWRALTPYSAGL